MSDEFWWVNFKGRLLYWWHNLTGRVGDRLVAFLGLAPRCECGWRLAQRFDGLWLCGRCYHVAFPEQDPLREVRNRETIVCSCYLCNGLARKNRESRKPEAT